MKKCKGLGRWFAAVIITGLLVALALPLLSPLAVEAAAPNRPSNVSPANGTTDIGLTHTFRSSPFSDPTPGDTHYASQWQIRNTSGSYSSPVFDSGVDIADLTQITISGAPPVILRVNTTYYWHVRYQDDKGWWSSWSIETSFTTIVSANPSTPINISPVNGATGASLTPTLQCSAFVSPDGGATHAASQWQITTTPGNYTPPAIIYDSDVDTANLTQTVILPGTLKVNTNYYWRVRHQDSYGNWSNWSTETSFKTIVSGNPSTPVNISPVNGATDAALTPTLQSSAFASLDGGATHAASRWQIRTNSGSYTSPVFDSGVDTTNLTQIAILSGILKVNTNYYWHVKHQDSYGNWSDWSIETSFTTIADTTPPAISGVTVSSVTDTTAIITWTTDETSTSQVEYGTTTAYGTTTTLDATLVNSHRVTLSVLSPNTTYHYRVRSKDAANNEAISADGVFTTAATPDITPPVITVAPASTPNSTGAVITWTTNEVSTSQVEHGTTTAYGSTTLLDASLVTSHGVTLRGLIPNTTYHYRVKSKDASGNEKVSTDYTFSTSASVAPTTPTNLSPVGGATDISLTPTLRSSAFSDPDAGDTHAASQWQITTTLGNYIPPAKIYDSEVDTSNLIQIVVPAGLLKANTTYYWRVRYQDSYGNWSGWSTETSFTTIEGQPPAPPTNSSPANGAANVSLTPTLTSSVFSDADVGDSHKASWWQITTTLGNYTSPIFDSGVDAISLTQIAVPSGIMMVNTAYYWHVKYQDSYGNWSGWSAETSFTTTAMQVPATPSNISPADGATSVSLTPTLTSSPFSDPDVGDRHTMSVWEIATDDLFSNIVCSCGVYDSESDPSNLTQITVPSGYLDYDITYYWHVRYYDSYGNPSDWSTETSFTTAQVPVTPSNISPANGVTGISVTPMLTSSAFSDPDVGDSHQASQWQIRTESGTYNSPVYDSETDTINKTSIIIPSGTLSHNTTYYWQVRHQDSYGYWSNWSAETSFTTVVPGIPSRPSDVSPADSSTGIVLTPTLRASVFDDDADPGDTHAASQWQIRKATDPPDYSVTVYDSGTDTANLSQITIPSGILDYGIIYYWRVKYQDSSGDWSAYSTETSFKTVTLSK